jgi:hypothetical protein
MDLELRREAVAFTRYLVRTEPSEALIARYCEANRTLFGAPAPDEARVLAFARRHAWAIPPLDASAGVLRPGSLLRKKLLVMMAILETTPEHAPRTEPRAASLPGLVLRLGTAGIAAAFNLAVGIALSAAITRRRG